MPNFKSRNRVNNTTFRHFSNRPCRNEFGRWFALSVWHFIHLVATWFGRVKRYFSKKLIQQQNLWED